VGEIADEFDLPDSSIVRLAPTVHGDGDTGFVATLVDIARAKGVSGYIGTAGGRDLNAPMTRGFQVLPSPKRKRFSLNYHLLAIGDRPERVRLQTWVGDGEAVPSVIDVWPTADWHEREAWDLMGIHFDGHPNLKRILLDDDWEGHPLRKDYPIGGEPVRFSEET